MMRDDRAVATVVGAIVVLAVLGISLVYVNAYHVPRQGAALEVATTEAAEASLLRLASTLAQGGESPLVHDIPLRAPRGTPPLLAGVVLSPARPEGQLSLATDGTRLTISAVMPAPEGGVPANDPVRVDVGGGNMRLYALGNASTGQPLGALTARVGGAYLDAAGYRMEGGALLAQREGGSVLLSPPALDVSRAGGITSASWRVPLLAGATSETTGGATAQVALRPGPLARLGTALVHNTTIRVETDSVASWQSALTQLVGASGIVNVTLTGPADNGTVEAIILPPPGTPDGTRAVELRLWAVRHEVTIATRTG